jgi:hypothetical protein
MIGIPLTMYVDFMVLAGRDYLFLLGYTMSSVFVAWFLAKNAMFQALTKHIQIIMETFGDSLIKLIQGQHITRNPGNDNIRILQKW